MKNLGNILSDYKLENNQIIFEADLNTDKINPSWPQIQTITHIFVQNALLDRVKRAILARKPSFQCPDIRRATRSRQNVPKLDTLKLEPGFFGIAAKEFSRPISGNNYDQSASL